MSKQYYGKKRFVPNNCPECHACRPKLGKVKTLADADEVVSHYWIGYNVYMDRLQPGFEGIDRWYGECMRCMQQTYL